MDLTGTALYMGSPSAYAQIVADLELDPDRFELILRKEILWESATATDAEVRAMEMKLIREAGANDPAKGIACPGACWASGRRTAGNPSSRCLPRRLAKLSLVRR
jgi:hypothetical protein